jgi:uncharacterized protein
MTGFLGTGWAFPIHRGGDGDVALVADEDLVAQSIWLILATAPGERVQRPDFGCGIHDLVFSVADSAASGSIADAVRTALGRYEPRIDLLGVSVAPSAQDPATLDIAIDYVVRTTNNRFNLVYPFYLEGGGR